LGAGALEWRGQVRFVEAYDDQARANKRRRRREQATA